MPTQVSFTTDKALKDRAMAKAKEKGVTLKYVLVSSMKAFADGKIDLGIVPTEIEVEEIKFEDAKLLKKADKLAKLLS